MGKTHHETSTTYLRDPRQLRTPRCGRLKSEFAILACRPALLGWQMFVAGSAHLSDVSAIVERFTSWGVPFPTFNGYLSAGTEIVCGLLLAAGLGSRLITIPLIINFCVAYLTASRDVVLNIFDDPDAFVSDAAFLFLLASLIVFIFGAGAFSVDAVLQKVLAGSRRWTAVPVRLMPAKARP
jgi:putative oxidoreductase